ncbi:MAG: AbrB/MazE/SpoVT family DNA-binding domain-containing protein [Betaproteobacteria bacterium]|nr:AbrB/MazE/SpoVT family DNA-binding domain-containing protein [Betaproteobacteria bacterium]
MSAMVKIAKVSSKGQITLPRDVRAALGTDHVRIVYSSGEVRIEPVNDVAGSLAHYAKGKKKIPYRVARERAWEAVVREKHKRR